MSEKLGRSTKPAMGAMSTSCLGGRLKLVVTEQQQKVEKQY
jgi:hypothetical protein